MFQMLGLKCIKRKMVDTALENAETQVDEFAKKASASVKKTAPKAAATKTTARKTS